MKDYAKIAERCTEAAIKLLKAIEADIRNGTVERTFVAIGKMTGRQIGKVLGALIGGVVGDLAGGPVCGVVGSAIGGVLGKALGERLGKSLGKKAAAKVHKLLNNLRQREAMNVETI